MFKHTTKILALLLIFASIVMFNGCQDKQSITSPDAGTKILSKDLSFTMPAGASLVSASLKLYAWSWAANPQTVEVHSITSPWSCPVTWNSFNGAFNPANITTFNTGAVSPEWKTVDITSTVQDWIAGGMNYGVLLKNQDIAQGLAYWWSNEYVADPTLRPYLEIVTTAGTFQIEPQYDTYITSLDADNSYCSEEKLYVGYVVLDNTEAHKYTLLKFDITPTQTERCETAYAFGGNLAQCFLTLSPISGNNWGWTNLITPGYTGQWPLYAGAGQCDISKGTLVGHVDVSYVGGTITIDYVLDAGFNLSETHVWIGTDKLPKKNGVYQTAPGKFNYNGQDPVVLTGQTGNKYVAVHAGVCWFE